MIKRLLTMLCILLLLTVRAAVCQQESALTLMVYLCGSNLESEAGAASADLAEMMAHYPADGNIRVIVMPSGSKAWQSDVAAEETSIYELTGNGLEQRCTLPAQNMGDPTALTALLDYGYTNAPAQQYALLMWNHGAGPHVGLCFDERFTSDSMDGLTLTELSLALAQSPAAEKKLSWIGFDACLMASVETACAIAPYADYMIASQETEPASGWSYSFLEQLTEDSTGAETGRHVIDAYFDSLAESLASLALSCVELRHMPAISAAMDQLFSSLHLQLDESSFPAFADCRVNSKSLGNSTSYEYDLIDLVDLLEVYQAEGMAECGELLALLDRAIVDSRSNTPYVNGLSIYYPHYGTDDSPSTAASGEYAAFIADMSALRLGKPLTDWSQTSRPAASLTDGVTQVTLSLTPDQAEMLDSAALLIFRQMSEDDYQLVYRTNDVALSADNVLTAAYREQALFIVDAQGNAVSDAIPYFLQGDAVVLSGRLDRNIADIFDDEKWYAFVHCYFRQDAAGRYRLAEVRELTDDPSLQGKTTLLLEDYDTLSIYQSSVLPSWAEDGSLLPPSQWAQGDMIYGWWFDLADVPDWSIAFLSQQDSRSRFALLQMTDTQNHTVCSELLPIANPNIIEIPTAQQTLVDNEYCCIRFTGAYEIQGLNPALRLTFTCENRDSEPLSVNVRRLQLDDAILNSRVSASAVSPGERESFEIEFSREELAGAGVQSVAAVQMALTVSRNYTDLLFEQPVKFNIAADLSRIAPAPLQPTVLDVAAWDGLQLSLLDVAVEGKTHITGQLRIRNLTDEPVTLDTAYFYLDNLQCLGYLTEHIGALTFPPSAQYTSGFRIGLLGYPNDQNRPEGRRFLPESLGMDQLRTLGIDVCHEDWSQQSRVTFTLPEPLKLPVDKHLQQSKAWPVIYDKDGVTIRLADCTWEPDSPYRSSYRFINLFMDNQTNKDVTLRIPWNEHDQAPCCLINGQRLRYIHAPVSPAETKLMDSLHYTVSDTDEALESIELLLQISDSNDRMDQLLIRIQALGEACTEDGYHTLDASQLQVSVTHIN